MNRLTFETLHGIWAGVTMTWDENFAFDEETYARNIERMIAAKVHGIYTTGSTGEFYAIDEDEFKRMVDIQVELCGRAGMPLQIGCNSDATHKTLRLLEYAAGKPEVGAAQVVVPYWMELNDREVLQFFKDLYSACPDLPLVHYNIPRAKRFLGGDDYLKILEVAPNLIGVKFSYAGSNYGALQSALLKTPQLSYFIGEDLLAGAMPMGARGVYSSLVCTNPAWMLELYEHAQNERWKEAIAMQKTAIKFFEDVFEQVAAREEGVMDPIFDKGLGVASGCLLGHQRIRPPHIGWSDETVAAIRSWLQANYPQFVYQG